MVQPRTTRRARIAALCLASVVSGSIGGAQGQRPTAAQSPAATRGRALAIEDYYRVKSVGSPEMSPDGKWVVFPVGTRVEATNAETGELWLVPADGSSPARRVSPEGVNAASGRWTADGRLRFVADGKVWSLDPLTSDAVPDTTRSATATAPGGRGGSRRSPAG